jgi:hypothetical protein
MNQLFCNKKSYHLLIFLYFLLVMYSLLSLALPGLSVLIMVVIVTVPCLLLFPHMPLPELLVGRRLRSGDFFDLF